MIVTVASFKGGAAKTTSAVHLAAYLHTLAPTLLLDADPNRSCMKWHARGGFPFRVAEISAAARLARDYTHVVIDSAQRPEPDELRSIVEGCDLLVLPAAPGALDTDALVDSLLALREFPQARYRVLITKAPPKPATDAAQLRATLAAHGFPVFAAEIPLLKAFDKAAAAGVLVSQVHDPRARRAWEAYTAAGRELAE